MAEKICAAKGCTGELTSRNTTGYCGSCYNDNVDNVRTTYQRVWRGGTKERRHCLSEGCDNVLMRTNKSGYCSECYRNNKDLQSSIHRERHIEKRNKQLAGDKKIKVCAVEGCEKILRVDCKSEYCKPCRQKNVNGIGTRANA